MDDVIFTANTPAWFDWIFHSITKGLRLKKHLLKLKTTRNETYIVHNDSFLIKFLWFYLFVFHFKHLDRRKIFSILLICWHANIVTKKCWNNAYNKILRISNQIEGVCKFSYRSHYFVFRYINGMVNKTLQMNFKMWRIFYEIWRSLWIFKNLTMNKTVWIQW